MLTAPPTVGSPDRTVEVIASHYNYIEFSELVCVKPVFINNADIYNKADLLHH